MDNRVFEQQRAAMVSRQLAGRDITDQRILSAMGKIPRHVFIPESYCEHAYDDAPQPIGHGQTISQPYVVASMIQVARVVRSDRVLEIGTGSGYQAAVLAELVENVWTIERIPDLYERAKRTLTALGYRAIQAKLGDGRLGWPEVSPFNAIIVSAASADTPPHLVEQLAEGGRMVIPLASSEHEHQDLVLICKSRGKTSQTVLFPVRFVPLTSHSCR